MVHKTLIGGTAYEVSGGKTLIGGTAYNIVSGKTLIGGTAYEIGFGPRWRRHELEIVPGAYTITGVNSGKDNYTSFVSKKVYASYSFSADAGFYGTGTSATATSSNYSSYVGYYAINDNESEIDYVNKTKRISVSKLTGKATFGIRFEGVDGATAPISFKKGKYIETLSTPEQELPSTGTLLEGGVNAGYCVMYDDDGEDVFYYELS